MGPQNKSYCALQAQGVRGQSRTKTALELLCCTISITQVSSQALGWLLLGQVPV